MARLPSRWAIVLIAVAGIGCGHKPAAVADGGGTVTMCPHASDAPPSTGTCSVTAGAGAAAGTLLTGTVLVPGQVLRGGQVLIDGSGLIQCVGCDCSAMGAGAQQVSCPRGVISPGLINTHDHITYTNDPPDVDTGERYEQRNDWRVGARGHTKLVNTGGATVDQVHFGELRFVMSGATSTVGSGAAMGLLRNLDRQNSEEAPLSQPPVQFDTFPLGDTGGQQLTSGCAYPSLPSASTVASDLAYEPHVSEGIDDVAHNEFVCLDGGAGGVDIALPQSAYIHAVALGAADYQHLAQHMTSLIWSPRSNIRLYGNTAMAAAAWRLGVNVALGTDWLPSGSMNMSRELACADSFNRTYLDGFFSDEDLWLMVTRNAARATHADGHLGTLAVGLVGDVAVFDGAVNADHRAVVAAGPADVVLVLRAGKTLYGDASVVAGLVPSGCDTLDVCGSTKSACLAGDIGESLPTLQSKVGSLYAAFFCGAPDNEPTCVPSRSVAVNGSTTYGGQPTSDDEDGDGIADATDDCPRVFNPIRPLDAGRQADADGDGKGDACDAAPLDPTKQ